MNFRLPLWLLIIGQVLTTTLRADEVLLPESADKRALVPTQNVGQTWRTNLGYADSDWLLCSGAPGGIGYEMDNGYQNLISLDVANRMHNTGSNPNPSCYVRIVFSLTAANIENIDRLRLNMRYDDGFVAYLNGVQVAAANNPATLAWNSASDGTHEANGQDSFDISDFKDELNAGANLLAIQALNTDTNSSDFIINAELVASEDPFKNFTQSNLPLVYIDTNNRNIPNEPKIDATMRIIYHGVGNVHLRNEPANDFDGRIGIETRGSSSQSWSKKQYAVETRDAAGNNLNASLMGLPAENDWVLNAPYIDKSFLRNVLAYDFSRRLGHYASRTRYCELFLNGEYKGIYVLMEKIKRDKNRVDIATLDSTDVAGEPLTGGYIFKVDKMDGENTQGFVSEHLPAGDSRSRVYYQYHEPGFIELLPQQRTYLQNFVHDFEDKMASPQFADPVNGYPAWIDVDSFIDFFLVSEIAKNVDSYRLSSFLYKDRDSKDGRLYAGPIWDYNLGFGLANYYDGEDTSDWMLETLLYMGGTDFQVPFWWENLFLDPHFGHRIKQRWQALRGDGQVFDKQRIANFIDAVADTLNDAQERNFTIWTGPGEPGEGFWPAPGVFYTFDSYQDEVDYLKQWIAARIDWMDANVLLLSEVREEPNPVVPAKFVLAQNYPNPFNPATTIEFELPDRAFVELRILNTRGQVIATVINEFKNAGRHTLVWNGADNSGAPVASGIYSYQLRAHTLDGLVTKTRKMLLLK